MALTKMTYTSTPLAEGLSFGEGGSYDILRGTTTFKVDPLDESNRRIVDLELATRNADGLVEFDADFRILAPSDPERANGRLCFVVNNRGRASAVPFSLGTSPVAATEVDAGDGHLLHSGWTIAWCGWQWDMLGEAGLLGIRAPEALIDRRPIPGQVRVDFRVEQPIADHPLADVGATYAFQPYPAANSEEADAVLAVRDGINEAPHVIARHRWRFARDEGGRPVADPNSIWLEGGFEENRFYEVYYTTSRSPVVGVGLLATRDFVSFLRYGSDEVDRPLDFDISVAFGHGVSQTGRYLRHFIFDGLNVDEAARPVFDGILPHIAGARRGEFNSRYAQPSHIGYSGVSVLPPYSVDEADGLFALQERLGALPKSIFTNTSWEYWRGDAAFNHIDPATNSDRQEGANHRSYLLAGIDHLGESPLKAQLAVANPTNPLSHTLLLRAAFSNLVSWVLDDVAPPPSAVPRIDDHSAVPREEVLAAFAAMPGAVLPEAELLPVTRPSDFGPETAIGVLRWPPREGVPYTTFVSSIDADGNEAAGVRLPEVAVPVATYTGWNPLRVVDDQRRPLKEFAGSRFDFVLHEADRRAIHDPRPALDERYANRAEYEQRCRVVVEDLVARRLLLDGDAEAALASALRTYDRVVAS